jgi:opacity protein-like surface antigen
MKCSFAVSPNKTGTKRRQRPAPFVIHEELTEYQPYRRVISLVGSGVLSPPTPTMGAVGFAQQLQWFGTVRARLGFTPADRRLVCATGGLAYGEINTDATPFL